MSFFDKLIGKIKKLHINISFLNLNITNIHIDNSKKTQVDRSNILIINNEEDKDILKELLPEALKEKYILLSKDSKGIIEEEKKVKLLPKNKNLFDFYRDKIPKIDFLILRASVLIKEKFENGEDVTQLKLGLIQNHGNRGRNISNLYSAGYFDGLLKNVYTTMSAEPDFNIELYKEFYEVFVTESPYDVFIYKSMSLEEVKREILNRIDKNKNYGIKVFKVHGIGNKNCKKIRTAIDEIATQMIKDGFILKKEINEKDWIISVTIRLTSS